MCILNEINIFMKIAILLPGQPRFAKDFENFLKNLQGYDQADWFCYLTNNNRVDDVSPDVRISKEWMNFNVEEGRKKLESFLPSNNYIQSFEISNCETVFCPTIPRQSHYKGWYNIFKANELRRNSGIEYDIIIRARADVGINHPFDLRSIDRKKLEESIIMPSNQWAGIGHLQSCDQFAIANSKNMNVYADLYNQVTIHQKEYFFNYNPEALLALHLLKNNIPTVKENFSISLRWA